MVAVSDFHKANLTPLLPGADVRRIYNPVETYGIEPAWNGSKTLLFASNPSKGLWKTAEVYAELKSRDPEWTLTVLTPGYCSIPGWIRDLPGVYLRGHAPHRQVIELMAASFAVVQANDVLPETFGLVYAEANAVGCPVLAYDFGAAREVLGDSQVMPLSATPSDFADRLQEWFDDRPSVQADPRFSIKTILPQWKELIQEATKP